MNNNIKLGLAALAIGMGTTAGVAAFAQAPGTTRDITRENAPAQSTQPGTAQGHAAAPGETIPGTAIPLDSIPEGALVISDGEHVYIIMGVDDDTLNAMAGAMQQEDQPQPLKRQVDARDDRA